MTQPNVLCYFIMLKVIDGCINIDINHSYGIKVPSQSAGLSMMLIMSI